MALCYDDHHRKLLETFLLQRAVEGMVSGMSMVFKDTVLQARSAELHLAQSHEKSKNEKDRPGPVAGEAKDKKKKKAPKNSQEESSPSSSDDSDVSSARTLKLKPKHRRRTWE